MPPAPVYGGHVRRVRQSYDSADLRRLGKRSYPEPSAPWNLLWNEDNLFPSSNVKIGTLS
jgi:hypothetical protein